MDLRYGMNPRQRARIAGDSAAHVRVLHGSGSMINYLDALNAWQLVAEARRATGAVAAASFKHVSPAGAALNGVLDDTVRTVWGLGSASLGSLAAAYVRARDADPRSSYGDMIAVSEPVDEELADLLATVVSDGIIAPGYAPGVVAKLGRKKAGRYLVFEMDPDYCPPAVEMRTVFGVALEQDRDREPITADLLRSVQGPALTDAASTDAVLGMIVARYTQSNSVVFVRDGMTVGVGAGQQSRVDCTQLAGNKARTWWLRRHPGIRDLPLPSGLPPQQRVNWQIALASDTLTATQRDELAGLLPRPHTLPDNRERARWSRELTGITLVSDGYLPFRDNIDVAAEYGVTLVVEPGGALRGDTIADACREHRIALARTDLRLFHH
ncbi:phosphoribosylaminoimidazolecarboxamide formyltransferase [Nocardia sp. NBC_01503]|uniref:phosphoribosylaminoimidazolecarboxamide formyltransferase n=1 Tax=Nocardia sp. NBC_01503 TaxID=2975997 RepID=UPI002E7C228B|nr:phosphoribosylaminoimidazolecarboxamide formyltransferase [Nocardia sp. NBC_01503]WTL31090.1 phosphoribosylaminoimidazolecarboxamide formyltransferase [Nocardia sp. NBC_01503]